MSILQSVQEFLQGCPLLSQLTNGEIHVEFTEDETSSLGLAAVGDSKIKEYLGGTQIREAEFVLYAKRFTTEDAVRLENSGFCEDFCAWVDAKSYAGELPSLSKNLSPQSITAGNGFLFALSENAQTGTYQIQIKLTYMREAQL